MKFKEAIDAARLRAGVWNRERKEKAAEKEAAKQAQADPAGVTVPLWLVRATKFAAWVATVSLMYFLWLYTLDIARDRAGNMHLTHVGAWIGDIQFFFPYIVGFAIVAFGIPYVAKIAIPTFMSLHWRGNFWPKLWSLVIAVAVSLVVIAGTFTVQGDTIMERDRDAAVAVEQVQQGRAALEAQIESRRQELADMMNNSNAYLAQAASVGAVEWERSYIAQARATNDPRLPMIERALGAARSADTARGEINALRTQLAQSAAVSSVQGVVTTERTSWIADTLGWLEGVRAILLSLVMDIVALMMPWIALRLEQARNRQMGMVEDAAQPRWIPIEDNVGAANPLHQSAQDAAYDVLRAGGSSKEAADAARAATRMTPTEQKRRVFNPETGQEEVFVQPKGHWRPTGKKRKNADGSTTEQMQFTPELQGDEKGVTVDGGKRMAVTLGGLMEVPDSAPVAEPKDAEVIQIEPSTEDDAAEALRELELAAELEPTLLDEPTEQSEDGEDQRGNDREIADDAGELAAENVETIDTQNETPITNPARLIGADAA